jgi:6-phosphogluconolactonase
MSLPRAVTLLALAWCAAFILLALGARTYLFADGSLFAIQEISTIPGGYNGRKSTAECLAHPNGKFLYVSNRGHETITAFTIDQETGLLKYVENEPTGGNEPRNFFIDPSGKWLLAENQNSD